MIILFDERENTHQTINRCFIVIISCSNSHGRIPHRTIMYVDLFIKIIQLYHVHTIMDIIYNHQYIKLTSL